MEGDGGNRCTPIAVPVVADHGQAGCTNASEHTYSEVDVQRIAIEAAARAVSMALRERGQQGSQSRPRISRVSTSVLQRPHIERAMADKCLEVARRLRVHGGAYDSDDEDGSEPDPEMSYTALMQDSIGGDSDGENLLELDISPEGAPIGALWRKMLPWIYDVAVRSFPWHREWPDQPPELVAFFFKELRQEFPGPWQDASVKSHVSTLMRQRRYHARQQIRAPKKRKAKLLASKLPFGCSKESWDILCAQERQGTYKDKFSHGKRAAKCREVGHKYQRFGRKGEDGFLLDFVRDHKRAPTGEEYEIQKWHGRAALLSFMESRAEQLMLLQGGGGGGGGQRSCWRCW